MDLLSLSIGIGLAVGLLFSEVFGLAAGGMIVPGYVALHMTRPLDVVLTLTAGLLAYAGSRAAGSVIVLFGRRLTVVTLLIGYLAGHAVRFAADSYVTGPVEESAVIGYIIPGLIGLWCERQGVLETIASLLTVAAVVRLVLVLLVGEDLLL